MQYRSPIAVLGHFLNANEKFSIITHTELRKRILAEFELTSEISLKINSSEYSKNDLLIALDDLKTDSNIEFHKRVAENPPLLELLETNKLSQPLSFSDPYFNDDGFIEVLSPYLATALGNYYAYYISNPKKYMNYTLKRDVPVLEKDIELLKKPVFNAIDHLTAQIETEQYKFSRKEPVNFIQHYFSNNHIRALNHLPPEHFKPAIDIYILKGYNIIRTYLENRKAYYRWDPTAHHIYYQIKKLNGSSHTKNLFNEFEPYLPFKRETDEEASKEGCYIIILLSLVIFIIFFIVNILS